MPGTTSVVNTTAFAIYVDGVKIGHATGGSLSVTHAVRDITSKDSGGWRQLLEGLRSFTFSASGYHAFDATLGADGMLDLLIDRATCVVKFMTEETGDTVYTGTCYVASTGLTSDGSEANGAYDVSFEGTGTLGVALT